MGWIIRDVIKYLKKDITKTFVILGKTTETQTTHIPKDVLPALSLMSKDLNVIKTSYLFCIIVSVYKKPYFHC